MTRLNKIQPFAQGQMIDLVAPGFKGLNLSQSGGILSPEYATLATNFIIDDSGRLGARDGITDVTTTPISPAVPVRDIFEYRRQDGTAEIILSYDGGISNSVTDPEGSDISGAVTDADGHWWFQNFNDKVIGFQDGLTPIVYNGTGTFATIVAASGTAPTGHIGLAAYGRVWGLDADLQTIKYSATLDETDWGGLDAGLIDMSKVWTDGTDIVTGLAAFNGAFVVFGRRHIVFWRDESSSAVLGIDPGTMTVSDIITGTGTTSHHTIHPVGESDLLFLSSNGVQSLKRLTEERSNPLLSLTKKVRPRLLNYLVSEDLDHVKAAYDPYNGFYLLTLPVSGVTFVLDQKKRYEDEDGDELSVITMWDTSATSLLVTTDNIIYFNTTSGYVSEYRGDTDRGVEIRVKYQSPWLDLGEDFANRLKMLKRLGAILFIRNQTNVIFKWFIDFSTTANTKTIALTGSASSEWGSAEWGEAEWNGGLALRILRTPARGRFQYIRIAIEADVNGEFALQQSELFAKIGRLA